MEETTFTNNASGTAEGGSYGEAALALTEQTSTVKKVAVFLPVTDEQLADVSQARSYINNRLRFMLRQELDNQIINGTGTNDLTGILQTTGIQSQAKGTDPVADAIHKAITKVRLTGRAMPNAVVMHPNDWQGLRLTRTSDGIYIWGNPSEATTPRIWGLPISVADVISEGTALVGDFSNFVELVNRRGVEVRVSDSHSDYFIKGKQAIRADLRVAMPVYRPAAFAEVTGI
jgi:HK97 family phage major capsid protein